MLPMYLADIHDNSSEAFRLRVQMSLIVSHLQVAAWQNVIYSVYAQDVCCIWHFVSRNIPVILTKKVKAR